MPMNEKHEQRCNDHDHHEHQKDHLHSQVAAAFHQGPSAATLHIISTSLDKPAVECYNSYHLDRLAKLSESTSANAPHRLLAAVKEAFTVSPIITVASRDTKQVRDQAVLASDTGLDPVPQIGSLPSAAVTFASDLDRTRSSNDTDLAVLSAGRSKLDARFRIGFSKMYGHTVQLNTEFIIGDSSGSSSSSKTNTSSTISGHNKAMLKKLESGTYVFEKDEMPYACVIENAWRGRLCEECLRPLPSERPKVVECPACPEEGPDGNDRRMGTEAWVANEVTPALATAAATLPSPRSSSPSLSSQHSSPSLGRAKFCSQACFKTAWKNWHGYECGFTKELDGLEQRTRLALRIYWQNIVRYGVSKISSPSPSPRLLSSKKNPDAIDSLLADATAASLSLTESNNAPRIKSEDGSDILLSQLCHNFWQLDPIRRVSFLMVGYYLQQLLGLPDGDSNGKDTTIDPTAGSDGGTDRDGGDVGVAAAWELAYLQAMVQFNSFAVKTQISESVDGQESSSSEGTNMTRMNDYAIGSALYLLASMFNHSCAPNAMVVFGKDGCTLKQDPSSPQSFKQQQQLRRQKRNASRPMTADPRVINVVTNKALKVDPDVPVLVEISYGPQGGRMATEERKECLRRSHLFECNCSACNDRYAEAVLKKIYKCPENGDSCRPFSEKEKTCPTCGAKIDIAERKKLHQLMSRLIADSQNPSLSHSQRLALLKTLENAQSKTFVDTCILYGNTCDQLAMVYAESGDLKKSIEWCKKALKVVMVHFPHDSIEVAQETFKLAGLYFNNMQAKEAMKQVQIAITLYKNHYGANSRHPDLLELYEMEKVLRPHV
ncbi:SET and MYND domain-containing protein 4 [Mortierella sp. NVP85]|nr:SET and MYND domain-containing protein 4 [Mortierella sp. NVP85]